MVKIGGADLGKRCEQLAKTCGDTDSHREKILEECKQSAATHVQLGCGAPAVAVYECYEKEVCGKGDKVWTVDDLRVLADRHGSCPSERDALRTCVAKKEAKEK